MVPVQNQRHWAQTEAQEVSSEHQETPLCCAGGGALAQGPEGLWGVLLGDPHTHLGLGLDTALGVPAGAMGDQMDPGGFSHPNHSAMLRKTVDIGTGLSWNHSSIWIWKVESDPRSCKGSSSSRSARNE